VPISSAALHLPRENFGRTETEGKGGKRCDDGDHSDRGHPGDDCDKSPSKTETALGLKGNNIKRRTFRTYAVFLWGIAVIAPRAPAIASCFMPSWRFCCGCLCRSVATSPGHWSLMEPGCSDRGWWLVQY